MAVRDDVKAAYAEAVFETITLSPFNGAEMVEVLEMVKWRIKAMGGYPTQTCYPGVFDPASFAK